MFLSNFLAQGKQPRSPVPHRCYDLLDSSSFFNLFFLGSSSCVRLIAETSSFGPGPAVAPPPWQIGGRQQLTPESSSRDHRSSLHHSLSPRVRVGTSKGHRALLWRAPGRYPNPECLPQDSVGCGRGCGGDDWREGRSSEKWRRGKHYQIDLGQAL